MHRGCASIASTVLRGRKGIAIHTCYNGKEHTGAHGFYTTSISTFPRQGRRRQRGGFPHNLRNTDQVMSVAIIAIRKFRWKNICSLGSQTFFMRNNLSSWGQGNRKTGPPQSKTTASRGSAFDARVLPNLFQPSVRVVLKSIGVQSVFSCNVAFGLNSP